jgi:deoxyribodipyrimidine photolyase-related protein
MRTYYLHIDQRISRKSVEKARRIVFILHDQLNRSVWEEWLDKSGETLYLMMESRAKGKELPHHKKKVTFILSAMRHFALELERDGYPVLYDSTTLHFDERIQEWLEGSKASLILMEPQEWDTRERFKRLQETYSERIKWLPSGFYHADTEKWKDRISPGFRMEYFYRDMRKQTGYLMESGTPIGGEWNFDEQNRKSLPKSDQPPDRIRFAPDPMTLEVMQMVEEWFPEGWGLTDGFDMAVTRDQALLLADEFFAQRLAKFGPYEDAMVMDQPLLYHSALSIYLNSGLLLPGELCDRAEQAYQKGLAPLNSVEGFIRQIIGWREYIRIYYVAMMPGVRQANHFNFTESLPEDYWKGSSEMTCLDQALQSVYHQAWSHHIPRLMVLSNFANLTQTDPYELHLWFWFAYADAYEWVELPNVLGMSTFADGGVLASKPYVSGGAYIHKMSDYCSHCRYDIKQKTGPNACPFNYLYWNFVDQQRETFSASGRVNFMVRSFDKKTEQEKSEIRESAGSFIEKLPRYSVRELEGKS